MVPAALALLLSIILHTCIERHVRRTKEAHKSELHSMQVMRTPAAASDDAQPDLRRRAPFANASPSPFCPPTRTYLPT
eukprot:3186285-Prymnesium_polylepis.1